MYRLPDGKTTKSSERYVAEWRKLTRKVEKALDARVYGFDPGMAVSMKDSFRGSFDLPMWAAMKIVELLDKAEAKS